MQCRVVRKQLCASREESSQVYLVMSLMLAADTDSINLCWKIAQLAACPLNCVPSCWAAPMHLVGLNCCGPKRSRLSVATRRDRRQQVMASSSSTASDKRSLLEKAWEERAAKKPRTAHQAPSIHDQVRKAITDHFKPPVWQHHDMYGEVRQELTLFQRLTRDFTAIANNDKKNRVKGGKKYYEHLEMVYRPKGVSVGLMEPDKSLPFSSAFRDALVSAEMHPPNRSPLNEGYSRIRR